LVRDLITLTFLKRGFKMTKEILAQTKKELETKLNELNTSRANLIQRGKAYEAEIQKLNQNIMAHNDAINETVGGLKALESMEAKEKTPEAPVE
jgi:chromosome segregation ATPase